jgi:dihydropteroate synthase
MQYSMAGHLLSFTPDVTHVMGVINLSSESKNVDTFAESAPATVEMAERYRTAGASIIDVGAQSSHFDNDELPVQVEIDRLRAPIEALTAEGFLVSVDTWKPAVAKAAIDLGAGLINDTGGMREPDMIALAAANDVAAVAMYLEGRTPLSVGDLTFSEDKASEVARLLVERIAELEGLGVSQVITDPGIGISYTSDYQKYTEQQLTMVRGIPTLRAAGRPVLLPVPRKQEPARVAAFTAMALEYGADIIRVHDVEAACGLVQLFGRAA